MAILLLLYSLPCWGAGLLCPSSECWQWQQVLHYQGHHQKPLQQYDHPLPEAQFAQLHRPRFVFPSLVKIFGEHISLRTMLPLLIVEWEMETKLCAIKLLCWNWLYWAYHCTWVGNYIHVLKTCAHNLAKIENRQTTFSGYVAVYKFIESVTSVPCSKNPPLQVVLLWSQLLHVTPPLTGCWSQLYLWQALAISIQFLTTPIKRCCIVMRVSYKTM